MVHQGGATSKTSRAIANVRLQLKTGRTRGRNSRNLTTEEIVALKGRQAALAQQIRARAEQWKENRSHSERELEAALAKYNCTLQSYMGAERDLTRANEAHGWLWGQICITVIKQVNAGWVGDAETCYLLDVDPNDVKSLQTYRKKMSLLLHTDRNKLPGAREAFVKFRQKTADLMVSMEDYRFSGYRHATFPTRNRLAWQLKERKALQATLPSLKEKLNATKQELQDAKTAWEIAAETLAGVARGHGEHLPPASNQKTLRDSRDSTVCPRCSLSCPPSARYWCTACTQQLKG